MVKRKGAEVWQSGGTEWSRNVMAGGRIGMMDVSIFHMMLHTMVRGQELDGQDLFEFKSVGGVFGKY